MAVSFLSHEVSDLCIGKPAVRAISLSATVGEAILALRQCKETYVSLWTPDGSGPEKKISAGKLCMVDILCYLCAEENVFSPAAALNNPVSALLVKEPASIVPRVEPHSRIVDALDLLLESAPILLVPIRSVSSYRQMFGGDGGSACEFCWLTQEDFVRFFFNLSSVFSPIASLSVTQLGLVRSVDVLTIRYHDPALSALPLIRRALALQTSVAVISDDRKLIGEISPSTLAGCGESIAGALSALSAGDLMTYIDWRTSPPVAAVRAVKSILKEKGMRGMLELMEGELSPPLLPSSSSTSSASSSSDEEGEKLREARRTKSMGSYSSRMGRRSEEAIVCHPGSSLAAVMVQALAHRVGYAWVAEEEDYGLAGIVVFRDILKVFRDQLDQASVL